MPKLPDATDLQAAGPSTARSFVNLPVPDIAGTARSVARGIEQVGASIENVRKDREEKFRKQERFDTRMGLLRAEEAYSAAVQDLDPLDPDYVDKKRKARRDTFAPVLSAVKDPENRMEFEEQTFRDYTEIGLRAENEHREARRGKAKLDVASYYRDAEKKIAAGTYKGDPVNDIRAAIAENTWLSDADRLELEAEIIPAISMASVQKTAQGLLDDGVALVPEVRAAIGAVASEPGMPPWMTGYLARIATLESSGGRNTVNPENDGVAGVFQFDEATARDVGMTPEDRFDVAMSTAGAARLALGRFGELKASLGRDPTMAELYLAHQQGAAGASKLLLNPDAPAASLIGAKAVTQNGGWDGMTAGQFVDLHGLRYDNADAPDDPDQIRELLATDPYFGNLSRDGIEQAVKWTIDLGNARERQQREQIKLQREEIYREFSELDAAGGLSQSWIDAQKEAGIASAREIRIFENTLRNSKSAVQDDPEEVASVVAQINGARTEVDVDQAQLAAEEAFAEGKISNATKARIAAGLKARRGVAKRQDQFVERGEKIISRAMRSRDFSSGNPAEDEITEMAGKIAFGNWLEKNPGASEMQIVTEASKIAKQVALDRVETVRSSLDLPLGIAPGWSRKNITREDLLNYAAQLRDVKPGSRLGDFYVREVDLIKKWLEIIDIQEMASE